MLRTLRLRFTRDYPCARLVETVTDYFEGAMSARERARLERHLSGCAACRDYLGQLRHTIELTGRLTVDDVDALPAPARETLLDTFRKYHSGR